MNSNGKFSFEYMGREKALEGLRIYEELQAHTATPLWRDHLPDLAIKQLYGKFPLVNRETVTPEFNVKKKIPIDNKFTLPANGKSEYCFDLVQSDSNKKTKFRAVVTSSAFPLPEDVQCVLDMTYEYGSENPYVLFFRPYDANGTKFVEGRVRWEVISEYPMHDLPYPKFPQEKSWDELKRFNGKNGQEDLISGQKGLVDSFKSIQNMYHTRDLNTEDLKFEKNGKSFSITTEQDGNPIKIIFDEEKVEKHRDGKPDVSFENLGIISFDLSEANNNPRYTVNLNEYVEHGPIWQKLKGGYACFINSFKGIDQDNPITVALFENQFDYPENFNKEISRVSFEIVPDSNGRYKAQKIHDEKSNEPYRDVRWAFNIRKGDKPGFYTYTGRVYFLMHTIFTGSKSIDDDDCPSDLKEAFDDALESWVDSYYRCDDEYVKSRIFGLMSIVGQDMGKVYFAIAKENIDRYLNDRGRGFILNDYIGYGLGDYTSQDEVELFDEIQKLPFERVICILSKAVWGNPDFIWNFPREETVKYFNLVIDHLGNLLEKQTYRGMGKGITMCLEYILAVYRLREKRSNDENDEEIMRELSQNNEKVQKLYEYVEKIIDMSQKDTIEIRCFLNLEIANKGIYERIPDLLYALLVYITGNMEAEDIKISGLSMESLGD